MPMKKRSTVAYGSSGYRGVTFRKSDNKWHARITINKKRIHLGSFCTAIEASNAYQKALTENFKEDEIGAWDHKEYVKVYQQENKEKISKRSKEYYNKNKKQCNKNSIRYSRKLKLEIIMKYGGKCECCGENRIEYLTIEHCRENGTQHRNQLKKQGNCKIYHWLKKNDIQDDLIVLCMNCNFSKGIYGYCPHECCNEQERHNKWKTEKKNYNRIYKEELVKEYGGKCNCCGESNIEMLSVHHVFHDGCKHRKELREKGTLLYSWLKKNGFPKDGYELLCMNCNVSMKYGYCPHKHPEIDFVNDIQWDFIART